MFVFTVIVVLIGGGLAFLYFRKPAQAPVSAARVPMTPERIARGKYLFEHVADCGRCHSERDFGRVDGPVVPGRQGCGNVVSTFLHGMPGMVVASNITPDVETGIGSWSDGEKIRTIREGVDKDGNALLTCREACMYQQSPAPTNLKICQMCPHKGNKSLILMPLLTLVRTHCTQVFLGDN